MIAELVALQKISMYFRKLILAVFIAFVVSACEGISKRTLFHALQEQSKYDCEFSASNECPRSPEVYDEFQWQRKQYLRE